MSILAWVMCVINLSLAVFSFVPCVMAGAMSMDSPQAQNSSFAIAIAVTIITFPFVCFACGVLPPILDYFKLTVLTILISLFPIIEAGLVILTIILFGN